MADPKFVFPVLRRDFWPSPKPELLEGFEQGHSVPGTECMRYGCRQERWAHPVKGELVLCKEHAAEVARGEARSPPLRRTIDHNTLARRVFLVDSCPADTESKQMTDVSLAVVSLSSDREVKHVHSHGTAVGETVHTAVLRGPAGGLYVVRIPAELMEELRTAARPAVDAAVERAIFALFKWRDSSTDRYGDDLVSLLLSEFGTDDGFRHRDVDVPIGHRVALDSFRKLSHQAQALLVEKFVREET